MIGEELLTIAVKENQREAALARIISSCEIFYGLEIIGSVSKAKQEH